VTAEPAAALATEALPTVNPLNRRPYSRRYYELAEGRRKLPVWQFLDTIKRELEANQVIVIEGETGSGKTTQIPQFLVHAGFGRMAGDKQICCTQPRRVAAMSIAQRVADEMDVVLGDEVGYTIRFEDKSNRSTVLKYASCSRPRAGVCRSGTVTLACLCRAGS
jgi:pre-mRNA-splicing factor ATP-dependent RNA helicase DHX15/PRP43